MPAENQNHVPFGKITLTQTHKTSMRTAKTVKNATSNDVIATTCRSVNGLLYVISVTRLRLCSETSFFPSNETNAFFLTKKMVNSISAELNTYGRIETSSPDFKSATTANEAIVIPMANEPELPTKILPRTLKMARISQKSTGTTINVYG